MATDPEQFRWNLGAPLAGDRAVASQSTVLEGKRIALLVTGGIAACRTPMLARAIRKAGAEVFPIVTPAGLSFVASSSLAWSCANDVVTTLDSRAQHVELAAIDAYLVAPATYSTIGKLAHGIADNAVTTTLATALGRVESGQSAILLAPAMHGSMANALLRRNLATIVDLGCTVIPPKGEDCKAKLPDDDVLIDALVAALAAG